MMRIIRSIRFLQDDTNHFTRVEFTNGEVDWFLRWATMDQLNDQSIPKIINKVEVDKYERKFKEIIDKKFQNINQSFTEYEIKQMTVFPRTIESSIWLANLLNQGFFIESATSQKPEEGIIEFNLKRNRR